MRTRAIVLWLGLVLMSHPPAWAQGKESASSRLALVIAPLRDAGQANPSLSSKLTDAVESELSARAAFEVRRQGAAPRGAADATPAARALLVGSHLTLGGTTALSLSVVQVKNGKVLFSATLKLPGAAGADADQLGKMVGTALANHIEGIERAVKKAR